MKWTIGDVTVTKLVELEMTGGSRFLLPQATPVAVVPIAWLQPNFADETGRLRMRIHSELRLQLGRDFRLWQDTAAIPDGALWEDEIRFREGALVGVIGIAQVRHAWCHDGLHQIVRAVRARFLHSIASGAGYQAPANIVGAGRYLGLVVRDRGQLTARGILPAHLLPIWIGQQCQPIGIVVSVIDVVPDARVANGIGDDR